MCNIVQLQQRKVDIITLVMVSVVDTAYRINVHSGNVIGTVYKAKISIGTKTRSSLVTTLKGDFTKNSYV